MHIPQDKRVRQYELTYLVPASLTSDEVTQINGAIDKLVKKHKGTILSQEDWGKKPLAYTILHSGKRYTEASYRYMTLEFETNQVVEFEKDVFLNQQLLRHLLVIAEADAPKATEAEAPQTEA